jgi:hypothetical protein
MEAEYTSYYMNQYGGGLTEIGPLYINRRFIQHGRGGIGAFFSGLIRRLTPLIRSGFSTLKKQGMKTGAKILNDIGKKPMRDILKEHGQAAAIELMRKGADKLEKMGEQKQSGSGTAHSFVFKKGIKRLSEDKLVQLPRKLKTKSTDLNRKSKQYLTNIPQERDIYS